jgi:hypothetical protein
MVARPAVVSEWETGGDLVDDDDAAAVASPAGWSHVWAGKVCSLRLSLHAHELIVREPRDPCAEQREADAGRDAGSADRRVAATWSDRRRFSRHTVDEPNQYQKAVQPTSSIDLGWEAIQSAQAAIRKCLDYPKPIAG